MLAYHHNFLEASQKFNNHLLQLWNELENSQWAQATKYKQHLAPVSWQKRVEIVLDNNTQHLMTQNRYIRRRKH